MAFVPGPAYVQLPRAPETWLIEDLLPTGGAMNLYGKPKGGKSYLALQMAVAISTNAPEVLGFKVRSHGPVCYLQIDTPRGLFATKYIDRISAHYDTSNVFIADSLITPYPFNILGEGGIWLRNNLAELITPPVLLIIDTLRELHSGDENDSSVMRNVMVAISAACRAVSPPPALILLSHARKSDPKAPDDAGDLMSSNRGSNYISGRMDSILQIATKKKSPDGYLNFQSRSIEEGSLKITRDDVGFWRRKIDDDLVFATQMLSIYPTLSHNALAKKLVIESGRGSVSTWTRRLQEVINPHNNAIL